MQLLSETFFSIPPLAHDRVDVIHVDSACNRDREYISSRVGINFNAFCVTTF